MLAIKIIDVKHFMNTLLLEETFDRFLLNEATIKTGVSYVIDGKINTDFYDTEEQEKLEGRTHCYFQEQRAFLFSLMKGKKTPLSFRIVFMMAPHNVQKLTDFNHLPLQTSDINGLFFNLHFEHDTLTCTSGTSLKVFTLDKTLDQVWDHNLKAFLKSKQIAFEEL